MAYIWWNRVQWDSLYHETYTYSPQGRLLNNRHDDYYTNQGLLPHYNHVYTYDTGGRMLDHIQQIWSSGAYQNQLRESWTYDVMGRDSLTFDYQWVGTPFGFAWDTLSGSRIIYTWTGTGEVATEEYSTWTTTSSGSYWTDYSRVEYSYSPAMEWDTVTTYSYMFGNWSASYRKMDMVWHDFPQRQCAAYILQLPSGGWSDYQRVTCAFNGRDSDCTTETWTSAWDSSSREFRTFDSIGHPTKVENQIRQGNQWSVQSGAVYLYTYDSLGRVVQKIDQDWDPVMGYLNDFKYVYSTFAVGMEEVADQLTLRAYPNPFADHLKFSLETKPGPVTISLYDLAGRLRLQCQLAYTGSEIDLPISDQLEQGAYIYHVLSREGAVRGRVVLQR
jgi:hypothetical protein